MSSSETVFSNTLRCYKSETQDPTPSQANTDPRFGTSERIFADINHAPPSTDTTPTCFFSLYAHKKVHTSPHTTSRLACAMQTHTSSNVTSSVKTYALINLGCLASLCHLVIVSDLAYSEGAHTRIYVCSKGLVHIDHSENGVKKKCLSRVFICECDLKFALYTLYTQAHI